MFCGYDYFGYHSTARQSVRVCMILSCSHDQNQKSSIIFQTTFAFIFEEISHNIMAQKLQHVSMCPHVSDQVRMCVHVRVCTCVYVCECVHPSIPEYA